MVIMDRKGLKRGHILQLIMAIGVVVLLSLLSGMKFFRLDLTSEKRYTLSKSSRQLMRELEDVVFIRIYLDGELPSEFVNFRKSIRS